MARRSPQWINSSVLMEALMRYQEGRLPLSMKRWVEELLDLNTDEASTAALLPSPHPIFND
ncbi:hypothetical protein [Synechococcus sp. UW105]|uniref:hypothetical protein n=1 Tax=Synechococcus sp. UW105 TaxID=337067 RepID=UPI000E0EACC9|nr:hypothetical protein [Synechococcus sp. UW105]